MCKCFGAQICGKRQTNNNKTPILCHFILVKLTRGKKDKRLSKVTPKEERRKAGFQPSNREGRGRPLLRAVSGNGSAHVFLKSQILKRVHLLSIQSLRWLKWCTPHSGRSPAAETPRTHARTPLPAWGQTQACGLQFSWSSNTTFENNHVRPPCLQNWSWKLWS